MNGDDHALIHMERLSKIYDLGEVHVHALRSINLEVNTGEMVAIRGPSGSGKSTLMNILGCLDRPTSGSYWLNGQDVSRMSPDQLAGIRNRTIGFVFQGYNLLPRTTALENVELPLLYSGHSSRHSRQLARETLESLGLGDRIYHLPHQLSGGQQQRVAISRALVTNPRMILADEPTGNLDTLTSLDVMSVFQQLNADGITIVLITHELDIASYAHRVVVLTDGRVIRDQSNVPRDARADRTRLAAEVGEVPDEAD